MNKVIGGRVEGKHVEHGLRVLDSFRRLEVHGSAQGYAKEWESSC